MASASVRHLTLASSAGVNPGASSCSPGWPSSPPSQGASSCSPGWPSSPPSQGAYSSPSIVTSSTYSTCGHCSSSAIFKIFYNFFNLIIKWLLENSLKLNFIEFKKIKKVKNLIIMIFK